MVLVGQLFWSPGFFPNIFQLLQHENRSELVLHDPKSVDHRRWKLVSASCHKSVCSHTSKTTHKKSHHLLPRDLSFLFIILQWYDIVWLGDEKGIWPIENNAAVWPNINITTSDFGLSGQLLQISLSHSQVHFGNWWSQMPYQSPNQQCKAAMVSISLIHTK